MKQLLLILGIVTLGFATPAFGQDDAAADSTSGPWKKGGMGSLTFNQVGLFNWAAGGQSNITLIGNLNLFANRTTEKATWENTLDLAYGFIKNDYIFNPEARITKAEDKIDFNSKYGLKGFNDKVFYTGLFNFRSQFDFGRTTPGDPLYISRFLSPAYMVFAVGLDYKPNDDLSLFISPASGKVTIVNDDSLASVSAFGVNQLHEDGSFFPGNSENVRVEIGATFRAKYKKDIMENIGLETQLELFSNYLDRPGNIDIRWNNAIVAKVNKYITVNLFTDLIYDHDVNIGRVKSDGTPDNSINPDPIVVSTNVNVPVDPEHWPLPGYDANDPTTWTEENYTKVQKKGPVVQFKEIFGVGVVYKF